MRISINGESIYEHRHVMEQMLGRPLAPGEEVHHRDEKRQNNDPANLELVNRSEHMRRHHTDHLVNGWSRDHARCIVCGTTDYPHNAKGMCRSCYMKQWR